MILVLPPEKFLKHHFAFFGRLHLTAQLEELGLQFRTSSDGIQFTLVDLLQHD